MRNKTIDIMKGITILLVVIWHNVGYYNGSAIFLNIVGSFFMSLFFLLSGYLVYGKIGNSAWLKKNTFKWITPIIIFTILVWVTGVYIAHLYNVGLYAFVVNNIRLGFFGVVTWFLWCLILCYVLMWGMERLRLRFSKIPFIFIALPILILIQFIPVDTFGIMSLRWYFIFFVFGYLANHYKVSNKIAYTSLLLFPLCLYLFKWLTPYEERNYAFQGFAFVGRAILNGQWMLIGVTLLVALLGIGFIFGIAKIIQKVKMGKFFIYLGVSSIGIYLLHILFVGIVNNFWLNTVLDIGLSIAIYEVLKRNHTTNWLLFGGKRREKYVA